MNYEVFKSGLRKGQPKTLTDRVIRFIEKGLRRPKHYNVRNNFLQFEGLVSGSFWFIGKNGAVRTGQSKSSSISITERVHRQMEIWEKENNL